MGPYGSKHFKKVDHPTNRFRILKLFLRFCLNDPHHVTFWEFRNYSNLVFNFCLLSFAWGHIVWNISKSYFYRSLPNLFKFLFYFAFSSLRKINSSEVWNLPFLFLTFFVVNMGPYGGKIVKRYLSLPKYYQSLIFCLSSLHNINLSEFLKFYMFQILWDFEWMKF